MKTLPVSKGTERGASVVEYAMLLALISIVAIAGVGYLGNSTSTASLQYQTQ
jgi:Flp pilus assembly pilin Flp